MGHQSESVIATGTMITLVTVVYHLTNPGIPSGQLGLAESPRSLSGECRDRSDSIYSDLTTHYIINRLSIVRRYLPHDLGDLLFSLNGRKHVSAMLLGETRYLPPT